jgi:type II secretory pathway pseudopilin PulG
VGLFFITSAASSSLRRPVDASVWRVRRLADQAEVGGGAGGFSILEICIVLVVIGILVVLTLPVVAHFQARAERVECMANLRNLHAAAELYLQQNESWPQIALTDDSDEADQEYAMAWIAALRPFGPTQKTWICPTIQGLLKNPDLSRPENMRLDYIACNFDDKPTTPHRWAQQPWFGEVGDVHGNGNLVVFADGSIQDVKSLVPAAAGQK